MSASATGFCDSRVARFWSAAVGKKAIMAATGAGLFLFVVAHLLGNLQVFLGAEHFNAYARLLHVEPALLWTARLGLLSMVVLHIWSSIQLALLNKMEARPVGYIKKKNIGSSYASRTMYWSGPIIAAFIVYHLMQFTWGIGGTPYEEGHAFENLVAGFQVLPVSLFYIVAMAMLMLHLYHGLWSMFQSLGFNHPRYTPWLRTAAKLVAIGLFLGFSSIPVGVVAGIVHL